MELRTRNVNTAIEEGLWKFKVCAYEENSRNGKVLAIPEPLMLTYQHPAERVLFWPERDANPVFHVMESLWMLAGRNDLAFVEYFNSRMANFSDDGKKLNGAYGHRWRNRFGVDQLPSIIRHLSKNSESRRAVLQMWGTQEDLLLVDTSKDVCCNTQAYFDVRQGRLNMTVCNRSNDFIWGMCGANAVHFSVLQEFIARALNAEVGVYRQFSNNAHIYTELYDYTKYIDNPPNASDFDHYANGDVAPFPLINGTTWQRWLFECGEFCDNPFSPPHTHNDVFFQEVAYPMAMVTWTRKNKKGDGMDFANKIAAHDWRLATQQWIERRESAK